MCEFSELIGKTLAEVQKHGDEEMHFIESDGTTFRMYHEQDCCESVTIEEIHGDLDDLVGSPILVAEESTSDTLPEDRCFESYTWTFYRLATIKGSVTIRWLGESNGYYSESVDFRRIEKREEDGP